MSTCRSLIFLWVGLAVSVSAQSDLRPRFTAVAPGLDYAHIVSTNQPWSIHVARLDRSRPDFAIVSTLGRDHIEGLAPVATQARSVPEILGRALAAVNGDFFVIKPGPYQGDPLGLEILQGELITAPSSVSFWVEGNDLHIEKIASKMELIWPDGKRTSMGLNQTPRTNTAVLFTPVFGRSTHATNYVELTLEGISGHPWLPLHAGQTYSASVREINMNGNTALSSRVEGNEQRPIAVLTLGRMQTNHLNAVRPGSVLQFSTALSLDLSQASAAIGGGPMLIHKGALQHWPASRGTNNSLASRNPRTALGFNAHNFFLVEVDGRQKTLSVGMAFPELAQFMKSLGCTDAMNLDGGGSSTFWLDGRIMNSPSDKHERSVANAVAIVRKKRSLHP